MTVFYCDEYVYTPTYPIGTKKREQWDEFWSKVKWEHANGCNKKYCWLEDKNMTDKERLIEFLNKAGYVGVPFTPDGIYCLEEKQYCINKTNDNAGEVITLGGGSGYTGFFCTFEFNDLGQLKCHGCWE